MARKTMNKVEKLKTINLKENKEEIKIDSEFRLFFNEWFYSFFSDL